MNRGQSRIRSVGVPEARGRAVILFNEEVGHFHQLPADFKDWKAHMSITATAVVKKETKVDPKKPQDKVIELPEVIKKAARERYTSFFMVDLHHLGVWDFAELSTVTGTLRCWIAG